jgi:hypothetical protein
MCGRERSYRHILRMCGSERSYKTWPAICECVIGWSERLAERRTGGGDC